MNKLTIKGISVMKKTRESSNSQIGLAEKQNLVACVASMGATHVEITMFTAPDAKLISHGFIPSPLSMAAETQQWYDVIHAQPNIYGQSVYGGYMKVFDRAVFPEGGDNQGQIASFPIDANFPVGTAASAATDGDNTWCGRYYFYLNSRVTGAKLQTGDIQCPWAEITGTAFGSNGVGWGFSSVGAASTFVSECHKICNTTAAANGQTITFLNNPNETEINSGFWGAYTDTPPYVCYDYYGNERNGDGLVPYHTATPADYVIDVSAIYAGQSSYGYGIGTGGRPQIQGEWGDLSGSIQLSPIAVRTGDNFLAGTTRIEEWMDYLIKFYRAYRDNLVPNKMTGFNYWGGWEQQNTSLLYKTGSGDSSKYFPNSRGQILAAFYKGNGGIGRIPVVTTGNYNDGLGGRNMHY